MSITTWMATSTAYRTYRAATVRCIEVFAPVTTARAAAHHPITEITRGTEIRWTVENTRYSPDYRQRAHAELHARLADQLPDRTFVARGNHGDNGPYWEVSYDVPGDTRTLTKRISAAGTDEEIIAAAVTAVSAHITAAEARIAAAAQREAEKAAAEQVRAERIAARQARGRAATDRQAAYLHDLGATAEEIEAMTVTEASAEIDRRKTARQRPARRSRRDFVSQVMADSFGLTSPARDGECHFCGLDVTTCDCH